MLQQGGPPVGAYQSPSSGTYWLPVTYGHL